MNAEIPLSVGGVLRYEPTTRSRPTSATCSLAGTTGSVISSPTVTIDPVETTTEGEVLAGETVLTLTSVTGIQPRHYYVVVTPGGEIAQVRVRGVTTGETPSVTLYSPLRFDVPDESEFFSLGLSAPVSDDEAGTLGEGYEARWSVVTADGTETGVTRWDVVRSAWPHDLVSPSDLERFAGPLLSHEIEGTDSYGLAFLDEIETATDDVRTDIMEQGRRPSLFRSFGSFKTPVIERVLLNMAYLGRGIPAVDQSDPSGYRSMREARYSRALSQALATTRDYDADESGSISPGEAATRLQVFRLRR